MKKDYPRDWLDRAKKAQDAAELMHSIGRNIEAMRFISLGHYCIKRYYLAETVYAMRRNRYNRRTANVIWAVIIFVFTVGLTIFLRLLNQL